MGVEYKAVGVDWVKYIDRVEFLYDELVQWWELGKFGDSIDYRSIDQAVPPNGLDELIVKLLGYSDFHDLMDHWDSDKAERITQQLAGPYGWSIYKAMLVRQND